mgnify:CR=1 FL=1
MFGVKENWRTINQVKDFRNYLLIFWLVVFGLNLNAAIFFLYPLSLGLNFAEMMFVYFSLSRIVYLIMIVPTGVIADRYSVKFCISFTILAFAVAYFTRGFLPFIMVPLFAFVVSEIIMGIADSSLIGASDKYQYSFSKRISDIHIFSINDSVTFFTRAIAALTGGLIVHLSSMRWTQIIGGLIISIGFILSLKFIKEPKYNKQRENFLNIYKRGFKYVINHKKTLYLIMGLSLFGLGVFASRNVFQPLLSDLGLNIDKFAVAFGLIFSLQMIFSGIGSYVIQKISKKIRLSLLIFLTLILMSLFLFSLTRFELIIPVVLLIWLIAFAEGSQQTQATIILNRFIKSENIRATINSISALVSSLVLVLLMPVIGYFTDKFGINANLYISSLLVLSGAIVLYIPHLKNKSNLRFKH